jgi:hypothetical protein
VVVKSVTSLCLISVCTPRNKLLFTFRDMILLTLSSTLEQNVTEQFTRPSVSVDPPWQLTRKSGQDRS